MKKILKSRIFLVIVCAIVFTNIGVVASTITSHDITYKNTTVEDAIDDLYTKAKPEYNGNTIVTPTTTEQILSTNNKILKSNITINPIPSTFKELPQTTTVDASNLLAGKTAYDNNGNLITGNISTDCISGSFICTECTTSTGQIIANIDFNPNSLMLYGYSNKLGNFLVSYNKTINSTHYIYYDDKDFNINSNSNSSLVGVINNDFEYTNKKLYYKNGDSSLLNNTYTYMACK